jgi:PhnB protein
MATSISTTIAPWLTVNDGTKAVEFYKAAFSAVETYRLEDPRGGLVVRLSINGAEFWVSSESSGQEYKGGQSLGGKTIRMILTVQNPDSCLQRALEAGATEIFPVSEGHGWRLGRVEDPFGLHWEIGHPISG